MAISLQDQLLNSGLINKSKANQSKKEKYKQSKQQRNSKSTQTNEATLLAQKTLAEKQAKDREHDYRRYAPGLNHIGFTALDLESLQVQTFKDGSAVFFKDPDGMRIEVACYEQQ